MGNVIAVRVEVLFASRAQAVLDTSDAVCIECEDGFSLNTESVCESESVCPVEMSVIEIVDSICSFCYGAEQLCLGLASRGSDWLEENEECFEAYCGFNDGCIVDYAEGYDVSNVDESCDLGCDMFECREGVSGANGFGFILSLGIVMIVSVLM